MPVTRPKISMVIGSYNRRKLLELCIEAVRTELDGQSYEIIVVDGGSTDGTVDWLVSQKDIIALIQHNRGEWRGKPIERKPWAYFMNLGFKCATGQYVCMLSDDSLIVPGAIMNGVDLFDEMLAQGVKLGGVAFYFRDFPVRKQYAVAVNVGNLYVNHGLYLRSAMEEVGYCDEDYHFYFADTDLVLKMKAAGYRFIASKTSFVEHYFEATPEIRASNNDDRKERDRLRLIEKWAGRAYPEEDREKYLKIVGYWDYHPRGFTDPLNTIDRLIEASKD
jgi:glycosyltransferase involved in cell wall biosynthesis